MVDYYERDKTNILDALGSIINPATEEKAEAIRALLEQIQLDGDNVEALLTQIEDNTDDLNALLGTLDASIQAFKGDFNAEDFATATNQANIISVLQSIDNNTGAPAPDEYIEASQTVASGSPLVVATEGMSALFLYADGTTASSAIEVYIRNDVTHDITPLELYEISDVDGSISDSPSVHPTIGSGTKKFLANVPSKEIQIIASASTTDVSLILKPGTLNVGAPGGTQSVNVTQDSVGLAKEAKQDTQITSLNNIKTNIDSSNTLLTSIKAKLDEVDLNTDAVEAKLDDVSAKLQTSNTLLTSISANDFATEATLTSVANSVGPLGGKLDAANTTLDDILDELGTIAAAQGYEWKDVSVINGTPFVVDTLGFRSALIRVKGGAAGVAITAHFRNKSGQSEIPIELYEYDETTGVISDTAILNPTLNTDEKLYVASIPGRELVIRETSGAAAALVTLHLQPGNAFEHHAADALIAIRDKLTELDSAFDSTLGEVSPTPTANTLLGRLKDIYEAVDGLEVSIDNIDIDMEVLGETNDPEATGDGSLIAITKRIRTLAQNIKDFLDAEDFSQEATQAAFKAEAHADSLDEQAAVDELKAQNLAKHDAIIAELQDVEADIEAFIADFQTRTGEVSATPTANTVLGRLKDVHDKLTELDAAFDAEDFASETTLAAFRAENNTNLNDIEADIEALKAAFDARDLATGTTQTDGTQKTQIVDDGSGVPATVENSASDGRSSAAEGLVTHDRNYGFNGSTWDRLRTGEAFSSLLKGTSVAELIGFDGTSVASSDNPLPVRESPKNTEIPTLTFVQTLTASQTHTTPWVDITTFNWLDVTAEVADSQIVNATLEFTDASDPNTTPPGGDDIVRPLDTDIAGANLTDVTPASFGLPTGGLWCRISVTDASAGGKVKVSVIGKEGVPGPAQIPIGANLENDYRATITRAVGAGMRLDGEFANAHLREHAVDYKNRPTAPLTNGTVTNFTVDDTNDLILSTAHGLSDGDAVVLSTTGTLPAGLELLTPDGDERVYFVINANANDFQVATNPWGTAVDITDTGTGTHSYQQRGQFVGEWVDYSQVGHLFPFSINSAKPAMYRVEWSADGQNVALDTIANSSTIETGTVDAGVFGTLHVGVGVINTLLRKYGRVRYVNGANDWTAGFDEATLLVAPESYSGSYSQLQSDLSTLSTALLVRSVLAGNILDDDLLDQNEFGNVNLTPDRSLITANPWTTIFRDTSQESGALPSGATPAFDAVGPIVASNVIDTGWINVTRFKDQSFHAQFDCPGVRLFLMNASDDQGSNSISVEIGTFAAGFENYITEELIPGIVKPIIADARFFQKYFRIVAINDSGVTCNSWSIRSMGGDNPAGPITQSLDQAIEDFFSAPLMQTINKGKEPDGQYGAIRKQGRHSGNSTTTPLAGDSGGSDHIFRGTWFEWQDGYVGMLTEVNTDQSGTLYFDFSTTESPDPGSEIDVDYSLVRTYDPNEGIGVLRRETPLQGRWVRVRFVNGPAAQSRLAIDTTMITAATPLTSEPLATNPRPEYMAGLVKNVEYLPDDTGDYDGIERTGTSKNVHITGITADVGVVNKPPSGDTETKQFTLTPTPQVIVPADANNFQHVEVRNLGDFHFFSKAINPTFPLEVTESNGVPTFINGSVEWSLSPGEALHAISEDTGGTSQIQNLNANGPGDMGGTATLPSNGQTSNDLYATRSSVGQTLTAENFTFTPTPGFSISRIRIGHEARKDPVGSNPQVEHVKTVVGQAGNVGSVTSNTFTSPITNGCYVVAISRENQNSSVTGVTDSLGELTFTRVTNGDVTAGGTRRLDVWVATGSPSGNFTVTATFSQPATNSHIAVGEFRRVNQTTPVSASVNNTGTGTNMTSGAVTVPANGIAYGAFVKHRYSSSPGTGYTERSDEFNTTGPDNDRDGLATYTKQSAGASENPAATNSTSTTWGGISVALNPADPVDILETISYELSGQPGATTQQLTWDATSDAIQYVDITSDFTNPTVTDVGNIKVISTIDDIGGADLQSDWLHLEVEETSGSTTRVSVRIKKGDAGL